MKVKHKSTSDKACVKVYKTTDYFANKKATFIGRNAIGGFAARDLA